MTFNRFTILTGISILFIGISSYAQETKLKFGDIKPEDFKPEYYSIDSSADAVYLDDIGSSKHIGNNSGSFSVVYKIHERIRLLHKKCFDDLGTVKIGLHKYSEDIERLSDLQAATYNIEDGKVISTPVDKNSMFKDKDGDDQIVKFTFPNLKEGSIIEYSYTKTIPVFYYIPSWTFQGQYPELLSEFTLEVPEFFDFVILKNGYLNADVDTVHLSYDNFNVIEDGGVGASSVVNIKSNTIKHTWAYKNVPALKEEGYITSLSNYIQKLEFQLSAIRFPNAEPHYFLHSWPETVDQLLKDEDFGQDLSKENGWLKDDVKDAVQGETDPVNKARKIYNYVRDNYTCTDNSAIYLSQTIKKTAQTKKGNVSDINMLLIAMLRVAGYTSDPVLLSTREHGKTYDIYPIMNKFNYLIARVNIDDKKNFLLDASEPTLGFGHLTQECYNGDARTIAATPNLIDLSADSLKEAEVSSLFLTNDESGKVTGTYRCVMGEMQSQEMREKMKKTNEDEYFKNIKKSFSYDITVDNKEIDSLKQQENPVAIQYNFSFKPDEDILYFNPVLSADSHKENPFSAATRFYPVEMPYCIDETYVLNMEVPTGYKVDELPKSARVSLNDNQGMFQYLIQQTDNHIQLLCRTKLNRATFEAEDYETLRNFFAAVVQKESEQIVFKKL